MTSVVDFATKCGLGNRPISVNSLIRKFATKSVRDAIARHSLVGGSPVRAVQLVRGSDNRVVFSDTTTFSSANLCGLVLAPRPGVTPLDQRIKALVADKASGTPFKMRSDSSATISTGCNAHAELLATGSPNLRIIIKLPQNGFSLFLTTPDVSVGPVSVGLPGSVDPHANLTFDLELHANIIVPPVTGQPLRAEDTGGSSSNTRIVHENATAEALQVINDISTFIGTGNFLRGLTDDQTFQASGLGDFLKQFNAQLGQLPPGIPFVASYDSGSATLVFRSLQ